MKQKLSKKKLILIIVIVIVIIALVGVGVSVLEKKMNGDAAQVKNELQGIENQVLYFGDDEYEISHNIETYLLMGTDDSGNVEAEGTKEYRGQMADFLLLLVLDKTYNTYGFLQINRDTMTEVAFMDTEGNGQGTAFEQICIAHWYGGTPEMGCNNTVEAVSDLLGGIAIDGYYSIHMSDIATLNHAVGGVEVTLEDDFSAIDPEMTVGRKLLLSDEQAEIFVRGRMSVGDGANTSRMRRQVQYMQDFKAKLFRNMEKDASFVTDLLDSLEGSAVTDMPNNRMSVIVNQIYKSSDLGILQFEGESKEADTLNDGEVHAEFYADEDSIAECMATLCGIEEEYITKDSE